MPIGSRAEVSVTGPVAVGTAGRLVSGSTVEVTRTVWADDDPHCCRTRQAVVPYALDGDLAVVGDPEVGPAG